jgi:uncharacterized protein (TIGR02594 family)
MPSSALPNAYGWLAKEPGPRLLVEMLKILGTIEEPGSENNPEILRWATRIGLGHVYKSDSIAWCGLALSYACAQAGYPYAPNGNALWARNWAQWEDPVDEDKAMLGDVLVFARGKGGHVGIYVGEGKDVFHVLGGNQSDAVSIRTKKKKSVLAVRRRHWVVGQPANVRKVFLSAAGTPSTKEA